MSRFVDRDELFYPHLATVVIGYFSNGYIDNFYPLIESVIDSKPEPGLKCETCDLFIKTRGHTNFCKWLNINVPNYCTRCANQEMFKAYKTQLLDYKLPIVDEKGEIIKNQKKYSYKNPVKNELRQLAYDCYLSMPNFNTKGTILIIAKQNIILPSLARFVKKLIKTNDTNGLKLLLHYLAIFPALIIPYPFILLIKSLKKACNKLLIDVDNITDLPITEWWQKYYHYDIVELGLDVIKQILFKKKCFLETNIDYDAPDRVWLDFKIVGKKSKRIDILKQTNDSGSDYKMYNDTIFL